MSRSSVIQQKLARSSAAAGLLGLIAVAGILGCGRVGEPQGEPAYVNAPEVALRDRAAPTYTSGGKVYNGEQVFILERERRFVKIRSKRGEEGWIAERHLVGPEVFQHFEQLAASHATTPVQSRAVTHRPVNMRLQPGRHTEHLYQLKEGEKIELLQRAVAERTDARGIAVLAAAELKGGSPQKILEDWWLARTSQARVGWVLGRMIDIEAPLQVAQYAEGQRVIATFVLNELEDEGAKVPQYLMLTTEPKDGLPYDYNQIRVFTWNTKLNRYETAYRERGLEGMLPVSVAQETGTEGVFPTFTLRVREKDGTAERKYRLMGVFVRRIPKPGEQAPTPAAARQRRS